MPMRDCTQGRPARRPATCVSFGRPGFVPDHDSCPMLSAAPSVGDYAAMSAGDLEVGHHAGRVVFEDVAVVHPASRAVVGERGDADLSLGGDVGGVFPGPERGKHPIDAEYLEEEAPEFAYPSGRLSFAGWRLTNGRWLLSSVFALSVLGRGRALGSSSMIFIRLPGAAPGRVRRRGASGRPASRCGCLPVPSRIGARGRRRLR
jgi:hypothetical protein